MDFLNKIIIDLELHSVEGVQTCFENGVNPNQLYNGRTLFEELIGGYLRSSRFPACVKLFIEHGLIFENQALLAVLLDDHETLEKLIAGDPGIISVRHTFRSAFTPLEEVTLLHICAEFNHVRCAQVLIRHQADVNAPAGIDEYGFGGQTPVFHTVNQNRNFCLESMKLLIRHAADLNILLTGLIWGKGYDWETFIPSINPMSYTMMGLLPQFHRNEVDIYHNVQLLMNEAYRIDYQPVNIPNKYLQSR